MELKSRTVTTKITGVGGRGGGEEEEFEELLKEIGLGSYVLQVRRVAKDKRQLESLDVKDLVDVGVILGAAKSAVSQLNKSSSSHKDHNKDHHDAVPEYPAPISIVVFAGDSIFSVCHLLFICFSSAIPNHHYSLLALCYIPCRSCVL